MGNTKKKTTKSTKSTRTKKSSGRNEGSKREVTKVEHELPGGFWRQTFAVFLILLAVVFVATWFGEGGGVLNQIHEIGLNIFGWGVFALPVVFVFLAVKIFRAQNNKLPAVVWIASFLMVVWVSGASGVFNYGKAEVTNGGVVGDFLNQYVTQILHPGIAIIIYLVLMFLTAVFILQMSPKTALDQMKGAVSMKKKEEKEPVEQEAGLKLKINNATAKTAEKKTEKASVLPFKMKIKQPVKNAGEETALPKKEVTSALVSVSDPKWVMPTMDLFEKKNVPADAGNMQQNALIIKSTLADFGIDVEMESVNVGPRVAQYAMRPPQGINLSKISARDKEIAMNLAAGEGVRIEAPIPGTRSVGVEVPNMKSEVVTFRNIIESKEWQAAKSPLSFVVGKDISGKAVVADLADMPHLLIAGTTGSGKSVMTNTLISSLIFRNAPSDLKLIIVDPKQVEMAQYEDIPHLLTPIITSTEKAFSALKWAEKEMDRRYKVMAEERVKKITDYNAKMLNKVKVETKKDDGEKKQEEKMPYIVIIIDEMSDLMMRASKDLEPVIVRIAQLGRAAGIHLVLATQKPIVKVITGLIKSNIPARIAFRVNSSVDSRIILDYSGAEKLLGKGDMLMTTEKMNKPCRIQGAWTYEDNQGNGDVKNLTGFLREQRSPQYNEEVIAQPVQMKGAGGEGGGPGLGRKFDPNDPLVRQAIEICLREGKFSTSLLQQYLGKGHGWVAGMALWLGDIGVIGPQNGNKPREMLISSMEEFDKVANLS